MPTSSTQRERLLSFHRAVSGWMRPAVERLASDADATLETAREVFAGMVDELPYLDRPEHSMAGAMFACAAMLSVFEVLRGQGVDAHAWGRAIHTLPATVGQADDATNERLRADASASQSEAPANEFVFELVDADSPGDGMNITSCAICHFFSKYDAMALVPYMCAFDDVESTTNDRGLRRSGTIALGAKQCDFRFEPGGEPRPLADQYPDAIRTKASD